MQTVSYVLCLLLLLLVLSGGGVVKAQYRQGPRIITTPAQFQAAVGESVTLPCQVLNLRRKSVFWMKGDTPETRQLVMQLRNIRRRFIVPRQFQEVVNSGKLGTDGTGLVINNLTMGDAGTYTCSITWATQSVSHTLYVIDVEVEAVMSRVSVRGGQREATLSCRVQGHPTPQVVWYHGGETVQGSYQTSDQPDLHHLQLLDLEPGDLGDYQCYVNTQGQRDLATISLISVPGPVRVVGFKPAGQRGGGRGQEPTITWEVVSLSPIVSYYVTLAEEGSEEVVRELVQLEHETTPVDPTRNTHVVSGPLPIALHPGTTYHVDMRAVNREGEMGPDMDMPFTITLPQARALAAPTEDRSMNKRRAWKLFKATLGALSRLPRLARAMQTS